MYKVSIMIPTYNQQQALAQAIESALAQDYPNLEIIVADDSSTDNTEELANKYLTDPRVKYFKNPKNLGRVGNYHKTLYEYASGDWAINLDADDYFCDTGFISHLIAQLNKYPQAVMVTAKNYFFYHSNNKKLDLFEKRSGDVLYAGNKYFLEFMLGRRCLSHLVTLYNRKKALNNGFYIKDTIAADADSLLRLMMGNKIIISDRIGAVWNIHQANASGTVDDLELKKTYLFIDNIYQAALSSKQFNIFLLKYAYVKYTAIKLIENISQLLAQHAYAGVLSQISFVFKKNKYALVLVFFNIKLYVKLLKSFLIKKRELI